MLHSYVTAWKLIFCGSHSFISSVMLSFSFISFHFISFHFISFILRLNAIECAISFRELERKKFIPVWDNSSTTVISYYHGLILTITHLMHATSPKFPSISSAMLVSRLNGAKFVKPSPSILSIIFKDWFNTTSFDILINCGKEVSEESWTKSDAWKVPFLPTFRSLNWI